MSHLDFRELETLRLAVHGLRKSHVQALDQYRASSGGYVHIKSATTLGKSPSTACSATCYQSLIASAQPGEWPRQMLEYLEFISPLDAITRRQERATKDPHITKNGLYESAELPFDNPFTLSFIVQSLAIGLTYLSENIERLTTAEQARYKVAHGAFCSCVDELLTILLDQSGIKPSAVVNTASYLPHSEGFARISGHPESAYITFLVYRSVESAFMVCKTKKATKTKWAACKDVILKRSAEELAQQIAWYSFASRSRDPYQLAYSALLQSSLADQAALTPEHRSFIDHAVKVFFEAQLDDGSWPLSSPLFNYPKLGDAYCYEFECLADLLGNSFVARSCARHLPKLEKSIEFIERRRFPLDRGAAAWSSEHHRRLTGPESWSTAAVYLFLHRFDRLIAECIRESVFDEFRIEYRSPEANTTDEALKTFSSAALIDCPVNWRRLENGELKAAADGSSNSLRLMLEKRVLVPISKESAGVSNGMSFSKKCPTCYILYGPPGTSKTKLVSILASSIGWPLLSLNPSHFLSQGMDRLMAEAERVFRMISRLEEVVVFIDEIDEMVRDRDSERSQDARFITTAMLPKLSEIKDHGRIIFIVATNHMETVDSAIRRQGRFDRRIQILPPCLKAHAEACRDLTAKGSTAHAHLSALFNYCSKSDAANSPVTYPMSRLLEMTIFLEREMIADELLLDGMSEPDSKITCEKWLNSVKSRIDGSYTLFRPPQDEAQVTGPALDRIRRLAAERHFPFRELLQTDMAQPLLLDSGSSISATYKKTIDALEAGCGTHRYVIPAMNSWAIKCLVDEVHGQ